MEGDMLVLSRKQSERIVIGSSILITVLKVDGNHVRLGIEAPSTTPIVRAELLSRQDRHPEGVDPAPLASGRSRSH
jgi:carbon storage regulator